MPTSGDGFSYNTVRKTRMQRGFAITLLCIWMVISMTVPSFGASPENEPKLPVPTTERLGGEERQLVYISTDKPIYKPGDTAYFRVVSLHALNNFPVNDQTLLVNLKVYGPLQNELFASSGRLQNSSSGLSWKIPPGMSGGRYEVEASIAGSAKATRKFEVRVYTPPRLKSQIEFLRDGYGPGDAVMAVVNVQRAEGGTPTGARVTAIARVDGAEVARLPNLSVDKDGNCRVSFTLPKKIERGEGSLSFLIEDGGVVETAGKTIPILLQTMDIAFYPESGDLIAGIPGRVYVQALRPDGKPADLSGEIIRVDAKGNPARGDAVARLMTIHEGRGIAGFTPEKGERYALRVSKPSGIDRLFPLPESKKSGAVIRTPKNTYKFEEKIFFGVNSTKDSKAALVTLYQREKEIARTEIKTGAENVNLDAGEAEGVLMATVWDSSGKPLAERLIFREPKFAVQIGIKMESLPAESSPSPGGRVRLKLETRDKNGQPVEATVGIAVTDDALLEMVEKRDQAPSLPVMVYLENEVKDLADAHVYFDPSSPTASRDIDLLLGTQGWRRFVLVNFEEALKSNPEGVCRALAIQVKPVLRPMPRAQFDAMGMRDRNEVKMMEKDFEVEEAPMLEAMAEAPPPVAAAPVMDMMADDNKFDLQEILNEEEAKREPLIKQDQQAAKRRIAMEPMAKPLPPVGISVREYAHKVRDNRRPNDRVDFTETIYWNAGLRTNPRDGSAVVEFDLSDSVTTFKVRADAFGNNGALGDAVAELNSIEPFYSEPKLANIMVAGDMAQVPVAMVNSTAQSLDKPAVTIKAEGLKAALSSGKLPGKLDKGARIRTLVSVTPDKGGEFGLTINSAAGPYSDTVTRKITVIPRGFPVQQTASGLIGPKKPFKQSLVIAKDVAPGSMSAQLKVYPTPLANMEEALNALLRQPYGCFEQTSSTSYPLVMAQQYFTSHTGISPDKIKKADELLAEGYKKLVSFESPEKGYEWFGGNPGHEALTAYGLMQFTEMKKVMAVDSEMIDRTRNWLLSRKDGKGGYKRNPRALDSFGGAPEPVTNIYITWTLLESGEKPESLKQEIEAAKKLTESSKDPYIIALGANILHLAGDIPAARKAAEALKKAQDKDGSLKGAETSITRSGGDSLLIETTSLTIIAWLRAGDDFAGAVESATSWLFERCKAGKFGSTQSTILALKAINAYDAARAKPKAPGKLQLRVDGKNFGKALEFGVDSQGALELPEFSARMTPGEHTVELVMTGGGDMPFALDISYNTDQPASSPECPLELTTRLSAKMIAEGEPLELAVTLKALKDDVTMPLAIIGMPAGLEPRHERLKELTAAGQIASYEIIGRDLVLYWRNLKGGSQIDLSIPFTAEIPGTYSGPASRAYAYYLDEHKHWVAGEKIVITPRAQ